VIRRATRADAADIARVHVATWQFAYAEILAPEQIASVTIADRVAMWERVLAEEAPVWVAEVEGRVVGFASADGAWLTSLYVDPVAQGAGVGTALLAEAERAGASQLQVLAGNGHARAFYMARGWREAGEGDIYRGEPTRRYAK
jgi:ribosomal protein S18 acetylase RimI-like enzyme